MSNHCSAFNGSVLPSKVGDAVSGNVRTMAPYAPLSGEEQQLVPEQVAPQQLGQVEEPVF